MAIAWLRSAAAAVVATAFAATASSASPAFARVTGATQGSIAGSSEVVGHEGEIVVESFESSLVLPVKEKTGRPGRKLTPGSIGIVKGLDRATPKLLQALATNERLTVEIDFAGAGGEGAPLVFYRLVLTDAIVTEIHSTDDADSTPREKVTFAWERLKSIDLLNGVEFELTPK